MEQQSNFDILSLPSRKREIIKGYLLLLIISLIVSLPTFYIVRPIINHLILIFIIKTIGSELIGLLIGLFLTTFFMILTQLIAARLYNSLTRTAKSLTLKGAREILMRDKRPPIIYLRPFEYDQTVVKEALFTKYINAFVKAPNFEQILQKQIGDLAPFIAVGNPRESLTPEGAARTYLSNDNWQNVVKDLLYMCDYVLIQIGKTAGVIWETEFIVRNCAPQSVLLCLGIGIESETERIELYKEFCERTKDILRHPLPKEIDNALFIYFEEDWKPHLFTLQDGMETSTFLNDYEIDSEKEYSYIKKFPLMARYTRAHSAYYFRLTIKIVMFATILIVILILLFVSLMSG